MSKKDTGVSKHKKFILIDVFNISTPNKYLQYFNPFKKADKQEDIPYKGVNVKMQDDKGAKFELQFHTQQSLEIKEKLHPLYEEQRKLEKDNPRKKELKQIMQEMSSVIELPHNIDSIANFENKERK